MKYEPNFDKGGFYQINVEDSRFANLASDDDSPNGVDGLAEKFLRRFWKPPVQDGETIVWTSLYLKQLATSWLANPLGFVIKLISLTMLPAFWSMATWTFSTFVMDVKRPLSCYAATFIFLWTLRDSVISLPARPSFRDFFKLFCHEAALKWMMWCVGFITYLYSFYDFNVELRTSKLYGLAAAVATYFLTIENVAARDGAPKPLRYIFQILSISVFTALSTVAGFFIPLAVYPLSWKCWVGAFFFGFVGFWIAVNLFYWPFGWKKIGWRDIGEPLIRE